MKHEDEFLREVLNLVSEYEIETGIMISNIDIDWMSMESYHHNKENHKRIPKSITATLKITL